MIKKILMLLISSVAVICYFISNRIFTNIPEPSREILLDGLTVVTITGVGSSILYLYRKLIK